MKRILEASLDSLNRSDVSTVFPGAQLENWDLPSGAKIALSSTGLPSARADDLMGIVGGFQVSAEPEFGVDGSQFYVLGGYETMQLVGMKGDGGVAIAPRRLQSPHPQLQSVYPSGIIPPVFVNSSIECFVECAWRYHWILPLLAEAQDHAADAERRMWPIWQKRGYDESVDPYAEYQELCNFVLTQFKIIDRRIQGTEDFWPDVIIDVW